MELSNKELFEQYRSCFSEEPVEVWRRSDASEPDGGACRTTAYRVVSEPCLNRLFEYGWANQRHPLSFGSWYPQDQDWILCDEEFYTHYFVKWPYSIDDTDRVKQLRKQIDVALWARASRYQDLLDVQKRLAQSRSALSDLLAQYRELTQPKDT